MKRRVKGPRNKRTTGSSFGVSCRSPNIDTDRDPPFTVEVPDHSIANKSFGMRMWVDRSARAAVHVGNKKMMKRAHLRFDVVSGPRDFNNTIIFHEHESVGFHQRGIKFDSEYLNILFHLQEVSTPRRNTAKRHTVNHPIQTFHFFSPLSI
ncbi:hypothetical protein C8J57DRAFT_1239258 [Mycena rebaudengoi]|nr:hypothetical protein C8J57DRAFT_1239258 [Mycena rebaudengoi]